MLWTYWNLGADLCDPQAPGRQERRQFLQRLLHDLGHPAGTHTFWPSCLPPDADALPSLQEQTGGYVPNADVFWSGARQLQARGVVVMEVETIRAQPASSWLLRPNKGQMLLMLPVYIR